MAAFSIWGCHSICELVDSTGIVHRSRETDGENDSERPDTYVPESMVIILGEGSEKPCNASANAWENSSVLAARPFETKGDAALCSLVRQKQRCWSNTFDLSAVTTASPSGKCHCHASALPDRAQGVYGQALSRDPHGSALFNKAADPFLGGRSHLGPGAFQVPSQHPTMLYNRQSVIGMLRSLLAFLYRYLYPSPRDPVFTETQVGS